MRTKGKYFHIVLDRCIWTLENKNTERLFYFHGLLDYGSDHLQWWLRPKIEAYLGYEEFSIWILQDFVYKVIDGEEIQYISYRISYYNPENKKLPFEYFLTISRDRLRCVFKGSALSNKNAEVSKIIREFLLKYVVDEIIYD